MLLGYSRISTNDQNLDLQLDALRSHGCKKFYSDRRAKKSRGDKDRDKFFLVRSARIINPAKNLEIV